MIINLFITNDLNVIKIYDESKREMIFKNFGLLEDLD